MRRFPVLFFAAALVAVSALVAATPSAIAASPRLSLTDPIGDAIDQRPSMDIANVSFEVKKVKPTDPKHSVIISLKLAAAPEQRLASYDVTAQIPECGDFHASYAPNTVLNTVPDPSSPASVFVCNGQTGAADGLDLFSPRFAIVKDTMTWTIALDSFPKAAREGGALTQIRVVTQFADPVFGLEGNATFGVPTDELRVDLEKEFSFV